MTVSKHTPGPWFVDGVNYDDAISIGAIDPRDGKRFRVAGVHGIDDHCVHCHQSEANVSLIAAAPDLLEALQDALRLMEEQFMKLEWEFGECREIEAIEKDGDLPSAVIKARAAIAKATGA